jgi:hypothetical protein
MNIEINLKVVCLDLLVVRKHVYNYNCLFKAADHMYMYMWVWEHVLYRARIFKRLLSPRIDSKEWIPPAYVAWRAGTITLFFLGS